ncbi:helix-turn-helix transcriptional regulator [Kitasatospora camelliae]|uniref:Helix-turn-helix transcriptional regulator n=1 Tax=Kitasatospora camelliae TaxID=3156397 RepID=A0AAU8JXB8_9ACTN
MDASAALYRRLLADPARPLTELRVELGCGPEEFDSAVAELRELGLLQPAARSAAGSEAGPGPSARPATPPQAPDGLTAVSVDTAARRLLAEADGRVAELLAALRRTRDSVERLHSRYLPLRGEDAHELVRGGDRVAALLEDAARGARTEALSLRPRQDHSEAALAGKLARERIALAHGVDLRTVYPAAALRHPAVLAHVRELTAAGARIRVAHTLPLHLIVVDGRLAVLPAPAEPEAVVVVRDPAVVGVVRELFEHFWTGAWVPPDLLGRAAPEGRRREVLRLLAAGLTDQAIGRQLEVSDRTVRRLVAELTADLGARSRFQAGVHAARLGWI